jgi:hypothetical protein
MTFGDWIFSIHLLFAATLVGSLVMSWIVVVSMRTADTPAATLSLHRVARVATGATIAGLVGVITFGICNGRPDDTRADRCHRPSRYHHDLRY